MANCQNKTHVISTTNTYKRRDTHTQQPEVMTSICSLLQDIDNLILNVSVRNVIHLNYKQFHGQIAKDRLTSWLTSISVAEIDLKGTFVRKMTVCIASARRHRNFGHSAVNTLVKCFWNNTNICNMLSVIWILCCQLCTMLHRSYIWIWSVVKEF